MLYRQLRAPISAQIELTTECSNNCPHCYNYQRQDDDPDTTMSVEQLRTTFAALGRAGVFSTIITGGEPGLRPSLVVEGIRLCSELNISCSINTNLTTLTEETLVKMVEAGKFTVLTSIASFQESVHDAMMGRSGAFRRTVRGVELLKQYGVPFSANMVVAQANAGQVYETGLFAHSLGARSFSATKASPPLGCNDYSKVQPTRDQVRQSLDDLLRLNEETGMPVDILECYPLCFFGNVEKYKRFTRHKCSAAIFSSAIGADGLVRPCSHSNRTYGNVFTEDLDVIFSRMLEWRSGDLLPEQCLNCNYFSQCSGGCRCEAEHAGDIAGMDPYALGESSVIPQASEVSVEFAVADETRFGIDASVRFRKEGFGYVVKGRASFAIVGPEAGDLLMKLQMSGMTLAEASRYSGFDPDQVLAVLKGLVSKRIVSFV